MYMWVIWFILKVPDLEVRLIVDTEIFSEYPLYQSELKNSFTNTLLAHNQTISTVSFKLNHLSNYLIVDNLTILQYDNEYIRLQQYQKSECIFKRNYFDVSAMLMNFSIQNMTACDFQYPEELPHISDEELEDNYTSFQTCNQFRVIGQFTYFQKGKLILVMCRKETINIYITYFDFIKNSLIQLYEYQTTQNEIDNLIIHYAGYTVKKFILIVNSKFMYFKQGQIYFHKISQIDEIKFSNDGAHLIAVIQPFIQMRKNTLFKLDLSNSKIQLIELNNKLRNERTIEYKFWDKGLLVLTDQGNLKYLILDYGGLNHQFGWYDSIGVVLIMIALFSIKINYF